ncbi:hypothetical protein M9458_055901, partial [Cirrhinus mrigala]
NRAIEEYVADFCELCHLVKFNDVALKGIFCNGLKDSLYDLMPDNKCSATLKEYIDRALRVCTCHGALPEPVHKMAAIPKPVHKMAAPSESLAKMAATPEPHQSKIISSKSHLAMSAISKESQVMADPPVSSQ